MNAARPGLAVAALRYLWEPATLSFGLLAATLLVNASGNIVLDFAMTNLLIQVVLAVGLYIFVGNSGIIAFGHITYAMVGAYADAWLTMTPFKKSFALSLPAFLANAEVPYAPAAIAASLFAGLVALLTALPVMRMRGIAISIGTFAVLVIFNSVYSNWGAWTFGASTLVGIPLYVNDWVALVAAAIALLVATIYQKSRFGLKLRAAREDVVAAQAAGVRVYWERVFAFALSGAFMGLGGLLKAHFLGSIAVSAFWIPETFILIAMLMIGGQRSLSGAVIGVVVVSALMEALRQLEASQVFGGNMHGVSELALAALMLVILIVRNSGITGGREIPLPWFSLKASRPAVRGDSHASQVAAKAARGAVVEDERLEARNISVSFDGLAAISDLSLWLNRGEVVGLIGPNGAGKTTLINVLTGFQRPTQGDVLIGDEVVTRLGPMQRTGRGLARTFQAVRLFRDLTVLENLEVAGIGTGLSSREARDLAWDILAWMNMKDKALRRADTLSYGDERRVGLARSLAMRPRFAFFDEPAAGTNEAECDELMALIAKIPERFGCGVLLIEHNMRFVMGVCERIYAIDSGSNVADGPPAEIQRHPEVIRAYLGAKSVRADA